MSCDKYIDIIKSLIDEVESSEKANITAAATLVADTIMGGGIVQAFGSGHSYACAMEISRRAGGLAPVKCLDEPSKGRYEKIEGVGFEYMKECDVRPGDMFVIISNTGVNAMPLEIALSAKKMGLKIVAVTALDVSRNLPVKHSSGKKLFELADVVLDNHGVYGDAAVEVEGVDTKVGGTSSIICDLLLNCMMLEAVEIMVSRGFAPPVLLSGNIAGGEEHGRKLIMKYYDRMFRNHIYY